MIAAKWLDPVLGVDIHFVLVPAPPSPTPIPTPLPHPFIGLVFDPMGAAMGAAIGMAMGGGPGLVLVNMMPAGNTGSQVKGFPHFPMPPGVSFAPFDIPENSGTIVLGSQTVKMSGSSEGRLGSLVMSCSFPIPLPTSICLSIPLGPPVLIGGPDAFDFGAALMAVGAALFKNLVRTKWFSNKMHKVFKAKPGSWRSKAICFVTGHPVDVVTGQVLTDGVDFELPGPIPLKFERNYYSRSRNEGSLGPGWYHPLDASVNEERWGITVRLSDGRQCFYRPLLEGESLWDDIERHTVERTRKGYRLTTWDGQSFHFEPVRRAKESHSLVRITDRCDNQVSLDYEEGQLRHITDSAGRVLRMTWTPERRLESIRLRRRHTLGKWIELVSYKYDREGRLAAVLDPKGRPFCYEYKGGVVVKETNRNGLSFYFEYDWYDPDGWCIRTWGDGGIHDHKLTYDKHRHVTVVEDSRGGRTFYHGNDAGLVECRVDPMGGHWRYEWDSACRNLAVLDPLGNRLEWEYDERGNQTLECNALGEETRTSYNDLNLAVELVDSAGSAWKREYDSRGQLTKTEDPLGNVFFYNYDKKGNPVSVINPFGHQMTLRYNDISELVETSDWMGHVTRYEYDEIGRFVCEINPNGQKTQLVWDDPNGSMIVILPDNSQQKFYFDASDNFMEEVDTLGTTTQYRYIGFNKLSMQIDAAGNTIECTYDTEENLIGIKNELGEQYRIEVDLAGRVAYERGFDGQTLSFRYDAAGRCIESISNLGRVTKFEYDALGRIVRQVLADGEEFIFQYDALGRLASARNSSAEVDFKWDSIGRIIEEQMDGYIVESHYDKVGNRVRRRTSLGHETRYDIDGNGELRRLSFGSILDRIQPGKNASSRPQWTIDFTRDATSAEIERHLPGGIAVQLERNRLGQLHGYRVIRNTESIIMRRYEWRSEAQIAALSDNQQGTTTFMHDSRSYLVAARRPDNTVQYRTPDLVGNIYRHPDRGDRIYRPGGALQEADGIHYVYDADGRLTERVLLDGTRWHYAWDSRDQLRRVTKPDGSKVEFEYDALGRRIRKRVDNRTTTYVWDGDNMIHELRSDEPIVTWEFEPDTFAPLAKIEGHRCYGVVTDHLGSPTVLFDDAGVLAWQAQLDLYGVAQVDVARTTCPWRWPGQYEDQDIEFYYNRYRYYDPQAGQYINQDPIGLLGGIAVYAYVHDPLTWMDPLGLNFVLPSNVKSPKGVKGKFSFKPFTYRIDTNPTGLAPGERFHIHVYRGKNAKLNEIAKIDNKGRWARAHGGKRFNFRPGDNKPLRNEINKLTRYTNRKLNEIEKGPACGK